MRNFNDIFRKDELMIILKVTKNQDFNLSSENKFFEKTQRGIKLPTSRFMVKKKYPSNKVNYRPVSVLLSISKIVENLMAKQINVYIKFLPPYSCGYGKGFSTQLAILSLTEKWGHVLDKKGFAGASLMDLSKAIDTISSDLLIARLHAHGFDKNSLKVLFSYLNNRWHGKNLIKILVHEKIPQGSVLGLFFSILS